MDFCIVGPLTTPKPGGGECPMKWKKRGDFCYYFEMVETATWIDAHYECKRKHPNATLSNVEDIVESKWISDMTAEIKAEDVRSYGSFTPWIGLYRSKIGNKIFLSFFSFPKIVYIKGLSLNLIIISFLETCSH